MMISTKSRFLRYAFGLVLATGSALAEPKPNVVVILTDDQGWGDFSLTGNENLNTPRIDSLARDGAFFRRFYVSPVCSPTRAEFLAGRYHPRGGIYSTTAGGERLNLNESTIADAFRSAGYATGAFGKWHNGKQYPYHPMGRGFDEFYGFCSGHWGDYFSPELEHNGELVQGNGFIVDDMTDQVLRFIEKNQEVPFFAYFAPNTPHSPMQVPDRFYDRFRDANLKQRGENPQQENLEHTRAALAMCENIDWNVGRILDKLEELGLEQDTIVVFFGDNGPNGLRWNDGLKGVKGSVDEGGLRTPCLVRWPVGIQAGRVIDQIAGAIDLLPTLTGLAGVARVGDGTLDGLNLTPLLTGQAEDWPERAIFSHWAGRVSVRTQEYRLGPNGALFAMKTDPGQRTNVAAEHPEVARRLTRMAADWRKDVFPETREAARPFPVGYHDFPNTLLPARDGRAHGTITRSSRWPNASFFSNWTRVSDRVTWDVEVATAGRYEVTLDYTCAAGNAGCVMELSLGESRLQATINEAHDPPLRGADDDRVVRKESYVKDFKPFSMGIIELAKGRGNLTLRALEIPGEAAVEVRRIRLRLLDEE
jgi:arylsulfatase A-like enzyme